MLEVGPPDWIDPEDDEDLPSDEGFSATWAFGPQGHPSSMRLIIYTNNVKTELWRVGPYILPAYLGPSEYTENISGNLDILYRLGKCINLFFGTAWNWWQCKEGCSVWQCPYCEHCRILAREMAYDFLAKI